MLCSVKCLRNLFIFSVTLDSSRVTEIRLESGVNLKVCETLCRQSRVFTTLIFAQKYNLYYGYQGLQCIITRCSHADRVFARIGKFFKLQVKLFFIYRLYFRIPGLNGNTKMSK